MTWDSLLRVKQLAQSLGLELEEEELEEAAIQLEGLVESVEAIPSSGLKVREQEEGF